MDEDERPRKLQRLDPSIENNSIGLNSSLQDTTLDNSTTPPSPETLTAPTTDIEQGIGQFGDISSVHSGSRATPGPAPQLPMSKSQLKKERKKRKWEEGREERKAKRKEKQAEKRRRKCFGKAEESTTTINVPEGTIITSNNDFNISHTPDSIASVAPPSSRRPFLTPITFILDCGFDELMLDKEVISLGNQVTRSYSENRRSTYRTQLVVSSFNGRLRERFETVLAKSYLGWTAVRFVEDDFVAAAEEARSTMAEKMKGWRLHGPLKIANPGIDTTSTTDGPVDAPGVAHKTTEGEIIYLTSDSEHTLTHLTPYNTYIIGGIVDRNRHKGLCYKRALDRGIRTAKLPIGDYLNMSSRFVLATNHVVEIMHRWLECGDWAEAFSRVIPKRKGGTLKRKSCGGSGGVRANDGDAVEEQSEGEGNEGAEEEGAEHASMNEERDAVGSARGAGDGTACNKEYQT
ncbi:hypothetical protein FGG08_002382 [Glutinoglossum americanum]|uniref:tRNA (guanine(9)-N1)-methyltransferase n=1 Tax=Glutinoglossum americanum TaxID=1670608 RepID=A0A9P8L1S4_9PEZI|nr:hypothetical protein FGG08_002382 [Glutinoglossum americanum]